MCLFLCKWHHIRHLFFGVVCRSGLLGLFSCDSESEDSEPVVEAQEADDFDEDMKEDMA